MARLVKQVPEDAPAVAHNVDRRMRLLGMNQRETALKAGLMEGYVRDILRGKSKKPQGENLAKLAKALETTVEELQNPRPGNDDPKSGNRIEQPPLVKAGPDDADPLLRLWGELSKEAKNLLMVYAIELALKEAHKPRNTGDPPR